MEKSNQGPPVRGTANIEGSGLQPFNLEVPCVPGTAASNKHLADLIRLTLGLPGESVVKPSLFSHISVLRMTKMSDRRGTVEAAAREAGVSRFHFIRRFKREMGVTPGEFILRHRIARAMNLLAGTAASIAAVGSIVGYRDASAFSRAFAKVAGVSPRAYRRAHKLAPEARVAESQGPYKIELPE